MSKTAAVRQPEMYPQLERLDAYLNGKYPFMAGVVGRNIGDFGEPWKARFEDMLAHVLPDQTAMERAVDGYVEFALDALRLHKRFEKEQEYINKTYAEAAAQVYHNEDYMQTLYLPGILLSHYLWPHHYRQGVFFENSFLADFLRAEDRSFCDVGIGTGFYSRWLLTAGDDVRGQGFDISESSKAYTERQVAAYGAADRYRVHLRDVVAEPLDNVADWLMSVEVLEHLEDPLAFLKALRRMLRDGGKAFVTAAITAPNIDHIYLYRDAEEVVDQLIEAGFALEQYYLGAGYAPAEPRLPVPKIGAYIVT